MKKHLLIFLALFSHVLRADQIVTVDGSVLNGVISSIADGKIKMSTPFAGDITIKMTDIASIETEDALSVRLESGETATGQVTTTESGNLQVSGTSASKMDANKETVRIAWLPGNEDPDIAANRRNWSYRANFDMAGRSGNSDKFTARIGVEARLEGPNDRLRLYARHESGKDNGETNTRETKLGARYTNFFSNRLGWYVRTEFENDKFEDLDIRSLTSAGLSYKFFDSKKHYLHGTAGLAFDYSDFSNGEQEDFIGIDFGLKHHYEYENLIIVENSLDFIPDVNDFGDFRLEHDSWVQIPISGSKRWNIRAGINNTYVSEPEPGVDELDSLYYSSIVLTWD